MLFFIVFSKTRFFSCSVSFFLELSNLNVEKVGDFSVAQVGGQGLHRELNHRGGAHENDSGRQEERRTGTGGRSTPKRATPTGSAQTPETQVKDKRQSLG